MMCLSVVSLGLSVWGSQISCLGFNITNFGKFSAIMSLNTFVSYFPSFFPGTLMVIFRSFVVEEPYCTINPSGSVFNLLFLSSN